MNTKLSQNIYSELIIGKYINQQEINEKNIKIDSELFIEIKSNFTDYENMYNNLGYSLLSGDSFNYYYLKKQSIFTFSQDLIKMLFKVLMASFIMVLFILNFDQTQSVYVNADALSRVSMLITTVCLSAFIYFLSLRVLGVRMKKL